MWLGLDVGGAYLKVADGRQYAAARFFPLWRDVGRLGEELADLLAAAPRAETLAVTMTGELADCFETKAEGVRTILDELTMAAAGRRIWVYMLDGRLVEQSEAAECPSDAAASNWHALARFAGRYAPRGGALLIDVGSTTTDLVPLADGKPAARGRTDPARLLHGELVYTGVLRSPVCGLLTALPWQGQLCPVAHEFFATTFDAFLILGDLPEDVGNTQTADGRPATRAAARDRLARSICADREMFDWSDAEAAATAIARAQLARLGIAAQRVLRRMAGPPETVIVSGQGEFVARRLLERLRLAAPIVSLADELGPVVSRAATAHALAVIAAEGH